MWWYNPYDPEQDYDEEDGYMSSMGTGQVEYTEGRTIIHFGSAEGSTYEDSEVKTWRNMSVLDWVNETRHG